MCVHGLLRFLTLPCPSQKHKVSISESAANAMMLPADAPEGVDPAEYAKRRETILTIAANLLRKQGAYQLATQLYTQAGDRIKAMKCLLKSGDTEKIILFAGVSRSKEIYVLAADYLQVRLLAVELASRSHSLASPVSLQASDWRADEEMKKAISSFYTKAKAWDRLAGFHDARAQVEIDDYRNYDRALDIMGEALLVAKKMSGACRAVAMQDPGARFCVTYAVLAVDEGVDARVAELERRIATVEKFIHARRAAAEDPETMKVLCGELLDQEDVDQSIRSGDVFTLLIEHFFRAGDAKNSFALLNAMRERKINVAHFLEPSDIQAIYKAAGQPLSVVNSDEVDEEIGGDD